MKINGKEILNRDQQIEKNVKDIARIKNDVNSLNKAVEGKQDQLIVNPETDPTEELHKITIDGITYLIRSGGGSSDAIYDVRYFQGGVFQFYKYNSETPIIIDLSIDYYNKDDIDKQLDTKQEIIERNTELSLKKIYLYLDDERFLYVDYLILEEMRYQISQIPNKQDKIIVNPDEVAQETLRKIQIDGVIYSIPQGGGSSGITEVRYYTGGEFQFDAADGQTLIVRLGDEFYNRKEIDDLLKDYTEYSVFNALESDFNNVKETVTHNGDRLDAIENRLVPIESDIADLKTNVNLHTTKINKLNDDVDDLKTNVNNVQPTIVTTVQQTTVDGYIVPNLNVEQVTNLYNALVAGRKATVDFTTSGVHQQLDFINATNLTGLSVRCVYQDVMVLTYTISGDVVNITYKEIGGGSGGDKLYQHSINLVYEDTSGGGNDLDILLTIISKKSSAYTIDELMNYISNNFVPANGVGGTATQRIIVTYIYNNNPRLAYGGYRNDFKTDFQNAILLSSLEITDEIIEIK